MPQSPMSCRGRFLWMAACLLPATAAYAQRSAIYSIDAESGDVVKLSHKDDWWLGSAAWSHDGKRLAYVGTERRDNGGSLRILIEPFDDPQPKELGPGDAPCFSPDDAQIVFFLDVTNKFGHKPGVWIMNADGTGREWLCEGTRPRWSPEGDRIAFVSRHEGFESVYVLDTVTLEKTRLLGRGYDQIVGASWSPDGKQLVFVGYKNGRPFQGGQGEVSIVDVAADQKPTVLTQGIVGWHPDWSSDGKHLVFWFYTNRQERLHVLELGSEKPPRLLPGQFTPRNSDPAWSPDGKKIAFSSDR